jgi:hypothetical protein
MGNAGHPLATTVFHRALATGNVMLSCAAASELGHLHLADAFGLLWVLRNDPRFPRAAARFTGRALVETPSLTIEEAQALTAALQLLPGDACALGLQTVLQLAERHGLRDLARHASRLLEKR